MRVPMAIAHTDNVYLAMWSMLREVHHHNQHAERKINTIACPGLGTGYGRVPYREAARQMALAYKNYLNAPTSSNELTGWFARDRQAQVRFGGDAGLSTAPEEDY